VARAVFNEAGATTQHSNSGLACDSTNHTALSCSPSGLRQAWLEHLVRGFDFLLIEQSEHLRDFGPLVFGVTGRQAVFEPAEYAVNLFK